MSRLVRSAEFISGTPTFEKLAQFPIPEVGIIGRSNVGKSSFINRLTNHGKLARSSSTPGRTQEINLFRVQVDFPGDKSRKVMLADLPGFGFAKFSKEKRQFMSELNVRYIKERQSLVTVCLLNDIRREPEKDELAIRDLVLELGCSILVVLTKADKLSRSQQARAMQQMLKLYRAEPEFVVLSGESIPVDPIWVSLSTNLIPAYQEFSQPNDTSGQ